MTASRSRTRFGRQLIGWVAAYAFVLHAVFAGVVAAQLAVSAGTPGFEICLGDADGAPMPGHGPTGHHDNCALHCAAFAGVAALVFALIALIAPPRAARPTSRLVSHRAPDLYCRAGQSRAPPLPA